MSLCVTAFAAHGPWRFRRGLQRSRRPVSLVPTPVPCCCLVSVSTFRISHVSPRSSLRCRRTNLPRSRATKIHSSNLCLVQQRLCGSDGLDLVGLCSAYRRTVEPSGLRYEKLKPRLPVSGKESLTMGARSPASGNNTRYRGNGGNSADDCRSPVRCLLVDVWRSARIGLLDTLRHEPVALGVDLRTKSPG